MDELRICPLNSWARPRLPVPSPSERLPNSWQHVSRIEGQLDWLPAQVLEVMLRGNWPTNANSASVNRAARPCLSELLGTAKSTSSVARGTPLRMPTANADECMRDIASGEGPGRRSDSAQLAR